MLSCVNKIALGTSERPKTVTFHVFLRFLVLSGGRPKVANKLAFGSSCASGIAHGSSYRLSGGRAGPRRLQDGSKMVPRGPGTVLGDAEMAPKRRL